MEDDQVPGHWQVGGGSAQRIDGVRLSCGVEERDGAPDRGDLGWFITYPVAYAPGSPYQSTGVQVETAFISGRSAPTMMSVLMQVDLRWRPPCWIKMGWPPLDILAETGECP